jgi:hypothetical protein
LRKGIVPDEPAPQQSDLDLAGIRQIVEVAVESALRRYGGPAKPPTKGQGQEDEETAELLDSLGSNLIVDE